VAAGLLFEEPIPLVAEGAREFAADHGAELCSTDDLKVERAHAEAHDTVGCVALDSAGLFAVATSTGGLEGNLPGRVGDSPQPGCGFYADNEKGAVAFSGDGELIARVILASRVIVSLQHLPPEKAIDEAIATLS
jgi:L-asparaginase / beta-aspartyl-peptidase